MCFVHVAAGVLIRWNMKAHFDGGILHADADASFSIS